MAWVEKSRLAVVLVVGTLAVASAVRFIQACLVARACYPVLFGWAVCSGGSVQVWLAWSGVSSRLGWRVWSVDPFRSGWPGWICWPVVLSVSVIGSSTTRIPGFSGQIAFFIPSIAGYVSFVYVFVTPAIGIIWTITVCWPGGPCSAVFGVLAMSAGFKCDVIHCVCNGEVIGVSRFCCIGGVGCIGAIVVCVGGGVGCVVGTIAFSTVFFGTIDLFMGIGFFIWKVSSNVSEMTNYCYYHKNC